MRAALTFFAVREPETQIMYPSADQGYAELERTKGGHRSGLYQKILSPRYCDVILYKLKGCGHNVGQFVDSRIQYAPTLPC
jgi:hypothetical protein